MTFSEEVSDLQKELERGRFLCLWFYNMFVISNRLANTILSLSSLNCKTLYTVRERKRSVTRLFQRLKWAYAIWKVWTESTFKYLSIVGKYWNAWNLNGLEQHLPSVNVISSPFTLTTEGNILNLETNKQKALALPELHSSLGSVTQYVAFGTFTNHSGLYFPHM